jgi:hypothetical protein
VLIIEVQLQPDEAKREVWPYYATSARLRHHLQAAVAVVTTEPEVARWAARPTVIGPPGSTFRALVLGPAQIPSWPARDAMPELVILAALVHAHGRRDRRLLEHAGAALRAIARLDGERATRYYFMLYDALAPTAKQVLEELMKTDWVEETILGRRILQKGEARGRAEGEARGRAEGEARGRVEGLALALLSVLKARGFAVTEAYHQRIFHCTEPATLERWLQQAVTAASVEDALA